MEPNATANQATNLYEKAENYAKTSIELLKLKSVAAAADVISTITSKIVIGITVAFFTFFLNVGISLWLGRLLGEDYYGFFAVALFYLIITLIILKTHARFIKVPVSNLFIAMLLKNTTK